MRASAALIRAEGPVVATSVQLGVEPFQAQVPFWAAPALFSPPKSSDPTTVASLVMDALDSPAGLPETGVAFVQVDGGTVAAPAVAGRTATAPTAISAAGATRHHGVE